MAALVCSTVWLQGYRRLGEEGGVAEDGSCTMAGLWKWRQHDVHGYTEFGCNSDGFEIGGNMMHRYTGATRMDFRSANVLTRWILWPCHRRRRWMECTGDDLHLIYLGSPTEFPFSFEFVCSFLLPR